MLHLFQNDGKNEMKTQREPAIVVVVVGVSTLMSRRYPNRNKRAASPTKEQAPAATPSKKAAARKRDGVAQSGAAANSKSDGGAQGAVAVAAVAAAPVVNVTAVWAEIESTLAELYPEAHAVLMRDCPPATKQQIASAEKRVGHKFPDQLKESLLCHDMLAAVEPLRLLGLGNSLKQGVAAAVAFACGPLATRFAEKAVPPKDGGLTGMFHLFTHSEDRTYFFLTVDCKGSNERHAISYLDFGDLVGDPCGTVIEWSFGAYLATVRDALRNEEPPTKWFPPPQFGFQGHDRILSLFAQPRTLNIAPVEFMAVPDVRSALREAYAAPLDNLRVKWVPPPQLAVALAALPPPPLPLQKMEFDDMLMAVRNYTHTHVLYCGLL